EPRHARRGRLHREQEAALQVLLGAGKLAGPQVPAGDVGDLLGRDLQRFGEVVLARPDVEPDLPRVGVLREEAVDRVGHAALLTDLLEEPRRRRAAEDGVEDRGGEAAAIRARDAGCSETDVVLLRVLLLEAEPRLGRLQERLADPGLAERGFPAPL